MLHLDGVAFDTLNLSGPLYTMVEKCTDRSRVIDQDMVI